MRRVTLFLDGVPICWSEYPKESSFRNQVKSLVQDHSCDGTFTAKADDGRWCTVDCSVGTVLFMKGPFYSLPSGMAK